MSIATQWHPDRNTGLDLARVGPGSRKAAFSQCDDGHVWQAQVHSRAGAAGRAHPPRRRARPPPAPAHAQNRQPPNRPA
ncbi:zinc-ribbon domain-containing protein, partial [Streptomyces sp. NPDC059802]|uniref:zinc-ribbon domain-containing protein n=1 Tax=Streptomyces sp. NPDC059802 TaxID=3346952 RepID=UPI00366456D4